MSDAFDQIGKLNTEIQELNHKIEILHNQNARAIMLIDKIDHEIDLARAAGNALSIAEGHDKVMLSIMSIKGLISEYDDGGESHDG